MAEVIRMPRMSDTMEEGNIIGWLKKVGDSVESGETIAEVETDKATMELDSFVEGVILHIAVKEGPVPIDGIIAVIGEEGDDWESLLQEGSAPATTSAAPAPAENKPVVEESLTTGSQASDDTRVKASPLAKSMAQQAGIDLAAVAGSGDGGRIVKKDLESLVSTGTPTPPQPKPTQSTPPAPAVPSTPMPAFNYNGSGDAFEEIPVTQMRKVIARRLGESKFTAPHFYLTIEIDMEKAMSTRQQLNAIAPVKISFNDLVLKACAAALRQHPVINSSWLGDKIRINKHINIGVAVAVEEGLLVPVIRHADMKSLSQINTEVKTLAGKAKERKLQPDEMQGNTFTISNLGMFGIDEFTAIINPPDACILAVGGIIEKPVVKNGEIVVGNTMKVTLSCDHRVVDGASGAQFLNTLKDMLEDPIRLLV